jgi:hypothetical protein
VSKSASFTDWGWTEEQFSAANRAVRTARHGGDEPFKHQRIEKMTLQETDAYIALVDGWVNAYEYAKNSGRLHHPTDGTLLGEWEVTPELAALYGQLERLARSVMTRAMRHANQHGGSYHVTAEG